MLEEGGKKLKEVTIEIQDLEESKEKQEDKNVNMELVSEVVGYFLEHMEFLLLGSPNPLKRATYFGLVFTQTPTYQELVSGTPKLAPYIKLIDTLSSDQYRDCEPSRSILEPNFFDNLLQISEKLLELGFTYYNGKVAIIESSEEDSNE